MGKVTNVGEKMLEGFLAKHLSSMHHKHRFGVDVYEATEKELLDILSSPVGHYFQGAKVGTEENANYYVMVRRGAVTEIIPEDGESIEIIG